MEEDDYGLNNDYIFVIAVLESVFLSIVKGSRIHLVVGIIRTRT